jgi:hypothetical protein
VQDSFFSLSFQSSLNIEALLFGVFGFLYALYGTLVIQDPPPRIVQTLRKLFKFIASLLTFNFLLASYALYLNLPASSSLTATHIILAIALSMVGLALTAASLFLAFGKDR